MKSKVVFASQKFENVFNSLKQDDPIKKSIIKAISILKINAFSGIQLPKRLIPKDYIKKYGINNLWKYDMPGGWRLLYTVTRNNEIEIISAIIEWFNHKDYEKRLGYKSR